MPSKTLIHSARIAEEIKKSKEFGININENITFDIPKIINRKNKIVQGFADYRLEAVKKNKNIDLVTGTAKFISKNEVVVNNKKIQGKNFLISTGSKTAKSPFKDLEKIGYITSDEALELKSLPKSIACLGAGPVSVELAYYFHHMGVEVIIIQRKDHILGHDDEDMSIVVEESFKKKGMKIYTNTELKNFYKKNNEKIIEFLHNNKKEKIKVDEILLGFGRVPNVNSLDLKKEGRKLDKKGAPILNKYMQTSIENIFKTKKQTVDYHKFPMAVYCHPEVAWIGITEKEARDKKLNVKVGKLSYEDLGKAVCYGETEGFIKFIVDKKTNRILGVGIVGHLASDIIHEAVPLLYFKATLQDLAKMPHMHPTFGEIYSYLVDEMI